MDGIANKRHHRSRLKSNRRYHFGNRELSDVELGMVVNTPTPCSCWMCQPHNKHHKKKIKEITKLELTQE